MKYDFDFTTEAAPRGTCSVKWDGCDEGVIPMWVAEMDFPAAPCILQKGEQALFYKGGGPGGGEQAL